MKLTITNGVATVTSESKVEAQKLVDLVLAPERKERTVVKHRKAWGGFNCDLCDYKGTRKGLAIHQSVKHDIRAKDFEKNRRWRVKHGYQKDNGDSGILFS